MPGIGLVGPAYLFPDENIPHQTHEYKIVPEEKFLTFYSFIIDFSCNGCIFMGKNFPIHIFGVVLTRNLLYSI
jgi:hypothetical protein